MKPCISRHRPGMTLIELLVVVAILGVLAVAVLPNIANTAEARRSREAARTVSSIVAKAQSRAIGRQQWSGFMLQPVGPSSYAAVDTFMADVPPVYCGDTTNAALTVSIVGGSGTASPSPNALTTLATQSLISRYDLIRFAGRGPLYEITTAGTAGISFRMRTWNVSSTVENAGQTTHNTPWPPGGTSLPFEVHRQPVPNGSPTSLADGRVIDLRWSGCGPHSSGATSAVYRRFVASTLSALSYDPTLVTNDVAGSSVTIVFDSTGRVRQFFIGANRYAVTGIVFLLVGRADRAGQEYGSLAGKDSDGANWQYADSYWVAIDSVSGVTKTAECVSDPGTSSATMTPQQKYDALIDSQRFVREQFN